MKHYRSYMDRLKVSPELHRRLLAGTRPERRGGWTRAAAAACCALVLAGSFWGFRLARGYAGGGVRPAQTAGTAETPEPLPAPPQKELRITGDWPDTLEPYILRVEDPFEGQAHGDFDLPGFEIPQLSLEGAVVGDYGYSPNFTQTCLTPQELVHALGGAEEVPWILYWAGFELLGTASFDTDDGELLREVSVYGERENAAGEQTQLRLTLTPGELPPAEVVCQGEEERVHPVTGVPVKAYFLQLENGSYCYRAECMSGDTGARLEVTGPDQEEAAHLILCFLRKATQFNSSPLTTEGLSIQREHVRVENRRLSLEEAYGGELGDYLPRYVPLDQGGAAGSAHWAETYKGEPLRRTLYAGWNEGYSYLSVSVEQYTGEEDAAYHRIECLSAEKVTAQALEEILKYVDSDAGDAPGWRGSFVVDYPAGDGGNPVHAVYSLKGLTPQQAAQVVNSCAASMCAGVPLAPTPGVEG